MQGVKCLSVITPITELGKEATCERRSSSTFSDLFCWAGEASATLRMTLKLEERRHRFLPYALYFDRSKIRNGEEGFLTVMEKFQANLEAISGISAGLVAESRTSMPRRH